jgi:hypothetical protein
MAAHQLASAYKRALADTPRADRCHGGFFLFTMPVPFQLSSLDQASALKAQPSNAYASRLAGRVRFSWSMRVRRGVTD